MALQSYFESLRCKHTEPVKIVLVGDNVAGSISTEHFVRRRFFDLDCSGGLSPSAPQRAESWQSSTHSSTGSVDSALSTLECNDEIGDRDNDEEEFDYHCLSRSICTRPTKNNPRRRRPVVDRFNFDINGVAAVSFSRRLPPPLPQRIQSPIFAPLGKKVSQNERQCSSS